MKYYIYTIVMILAFTSCSQVFEPTLKNNYDTPLTINIIYEDGSKRNIVIFDKCTNIGKNKQEENTIHHIDFIIKNKIVNSLNKVAIKSFFSEMKLARKKGKSLAWFISKKGIEIRECMMHS